MMHKTDGHNREHLVIQHCVQQCPRTVGFPGSSDLQIMAKGVILKKLSGTASIFPDCKFLVVQLLDMDASSAVKRMLFSGGKDQTVVDDGKNDKVRGMDLTFYHSSVQLRTQKLLFDILRVGDKGVNVKVRDFFLQIQDNGWGQAGSHSEGGAKLQGGRLSLVLHQPFQLLKLADHFTGMGKKKLSPFCEIKLFSKTFKEKAVIMSFQLTDGLTDCWLGKIKMFGSSTHGALFRNGRKNSEMADGHMESPFIVNWYIGKTYHFYKIISFLKYIFKWYSRKYVKTISTLQNTGQRYRGKVSECR